MGSYHSRQEEILETALTILHDKGPHALTMGAIAESIGVTEPAIYRHFDSKEDVVKSIAERVFGRERIVPPDTTPDSPTELIREVLQNLFQDLEERPKDTAILFHDGRFTEFTEVQNIFARKRRLKKKKLATMIEVGQETGFISSETDPETFATIFVGTVRATVLEWRDNDFQPRLTEKVDSIAEELGRLLEPS